MEGVGIADGSGGAALTVNAIGASAEDGCALMTAGELGGAPEGKLLVAATLAGGVGGKGNLDLAGGDEAGAGMLALEGGAAIEEVAGGFAIFPFVAGVVDLGVEAEGLGCRGGGLGEVVAAENDLPVRASEGRVGDLGGFYAVRTGEECRDGGREGGGGVELREQRVARGEGGAVGECGAGADGVGIGGGDVGDEQGVLMARRGCELGEPSAFDR